MKVHEIPISEIVITQNVRSTIDKIELKELIDDIKHKGLLQAIGVHKSKGRYILLYGHRRLEACKALKQKMIFANVIDRDLSATDILTINLVENLHRKNVSYVEIAKVINVLRTEHEMSFAEIGQKISMSENKVSVLSGIYSRIPKKYADKIEFFTEGAEKKPGKISVAAAQAIVNVRLTVRATEDIFDHVITNQIAIPELMQILTLIRHGLTINKAKTIMKKVRIITVRIPVYSKAFDEAKENYHCGSNDDLIMKIMQRGVKPEGLIFDEFE